AKKLNKLEETTIVALWRLDKQLDTLFQNKIRMLILMYGHSTPSTENICLAVKINSLLERLVTLYGICSYYLLINHNSLNGPSHLMEEEINIAKKTVFNSQLPKRDFISLSELLENSNKFKNSHIETCGILKMTKEWRESDKIGFILQHHEKVVDVILKDGVRKDILPPEESFVYLSGKFISPKKGSMIEIEKFDLEGDKKKNWLDHIIKLKSGFWYTGNHVIKSDRFLRFPETSRWVLSVYRRSR
ncbi:MAG: hypothetical protein ACXABJ_08185, partial [Candidatus Heimdallarchaeaceae archaeon]